MMTVDLSGGRHDDFCWSQASTAFLVGSRFSGVFRCTVPAGSTTRLAYVSNDVYVHNPVYSPDETRIAYIEHLYGYIMYVNVVGPEGGYVGISSDKRYYD